MHKKITQGTLAPWVIQGVGIVILAVVLVVWVRTDRQSTLLVAIGSALIWLTGGYDRAFYEVMKILKPGDPEPPK